MQWRYLGGPFPAGPVVTCVRLLFLLHSPRSSPPFRSQPANQHCEQPLEPLAAPAVLNGSAQPHVTLHDPRPPNAFKTSPRRLRASRDEDEKSLEPDKCESKDCVAGHFNRAQAKERFKGKKTVIDAKGAEAKKGDHFALARPLPTNEGDEGETSVNEQAEILQETRSSPGTATAERSACNQEKSDWFPGAISSPFFMCLFIFAKRR